MKVTIIMGSKAEDTANYTACMAILEDCKIAVDSYVDTSTMMKLTRGRRHPDFGLAITFPDGTPLVTDYFGLINWINAKGLRPI